MDNRFYEIKVEDRPKEFATPNDFHVYLIDMINNDIDREENMEKLYKNIYKFIIKSLHSFKNVDDIHELLPHSSIAFMKSIKSYDKSSTFINYYSHCLRNEIITDYYRPIEHEDGIKRRTSPKRFKMSEMTSLDDDTDTESDKRSVIENKRSIDDEDAYEIISLKNDIYCLMKRFPFKDYRKDICMDYLNYVIEGDYITTSALAKKYNTSQPNVSRILLKMRKFLKEEMGRV